MKQSLAIAGLLLLTACSGGESTIQHGTSAEQLRSQLTLEVLAEHKNQTTIGVFVKNPEQLSIQSIRSWVQYDASKVSVDQLMITDERFSLVAPGERNIDSDKGLISLGAATKQSVQDNEIFFARFTAHRLNETETDPILFSFYDWKADGDGHTAVLSVYDRSARNIVEHPSSLRL